MWDFACSSLSNDPWIQPDLYSETVEWPMRSEEILYSVTSSSWRLLCDARSCRWCSRRLPLSSRVRRAERRSRCQRRQAQRHRWSLESPPRGEVSKPACTMSTATDLRRNIYGAEDGRRRGRQRKCWMDNIKKWTSLPMPELLMTASCRKDWDRISAESSVMSFWRPSRSRDWTDWSVWKYESFNLFWSLIFKFQFLHSSYRLFWKDWD